MFRFGDDRGTLKCSFCGKNQDQVRKLIAGPGVYICDECIELCNEIIADKSAPSAHCRSLYTTTTNGFTPSLDRPPATTWTCRRATFC
jgi:hypothetical protein